MVQRAVRAEGTPPSADPPSSDGAEELGRDWAVLKDCRLGRPARGGHLPSVLMHPARGVAVLDILPADTPGAVEALRARLAAARFPAIFAGHLPVVHLQVAPRRVPFLPSLLDDAFAAQPPLDLPGGDAWVGVAARALTAEQPTVPRPESPRQFRGDAGERPGRRPRRRTAAALRKAGAVLLCLAALGGALGLALNGTPAPAPEALPPAAAEAVSRTPALPPSPVPDPVSVAPPPPLPAPAARSGAAVTVEPVPEAPPPAPPPPTVDAPSPPPPVQRAVPPPPTRRPEAAAAPPAAPATRRAPERANPQGPRQDAGTGRPAAAAGGADAAPRLPETPPDRCRRVSALVGSGAPLADADMRFFNGNCIRWE